MSGTARRFRSSRTRRSQVTRRVTRPHTERSGNLGFVTRKQLDGGHFSPATNPPQVTYQPWNRVIIVHPFTATLTLKVQDLLYLIRSQVDPTNRGFNQTTSGDARFVLQICLHTISVWNLTGRVISLAVDDFSDTRAGTGGRDQLCGLVDTGSTTHTPCIGYKYPSSLQHHVLRTDDNEGGVILLTSQSGTGDQCVLYLTLTYRFDGPVKAPNILSPSVEMIKALETIKAQQPSTISKVVDGVAKAAEVVYVAAASSSGVCHCGNARSDDGSVESIFSNLELNS